MKVRESFVSNSSSSSFVYKCTSKCKDLKELEKKLIEEFEKKLSNEKWKKSLEPKNLAKKIVKDIIERAEDRSEDEETNECCEKLLDGDKEFCSTCGENLAELRKDIKYKKENGLQVEFSICAGGTEPPYPFEDFVASALLETWKNNDVLTIDENDYEGM